MSLDPRTAEKWAASLTAETVELLPWLPYLLQDLWALGTPPKSVESLVREHIPEPGSRRFLDLGCGKGAVALRLAEAFGAEVMGVDLMPEFIAEARARAEARGLAGLCHFRVGEANEAAAQERGFDAVILGAVCGVLGSAEETVAKLVPTVRPGGWVILDDAYLVAAAAAPRYAPQQPTPARSEWLRAFAAHGAEVLAEVAADEDDLVANDDDLRHIERRAEELAALHPEARELFESYVRSQQNEIDDLNDTLVGVLWLLRASSS